MLLRGHHRLARDERRRLRQRREDAARVQPARALLAEDQVPVDLAGLHLRGGAVAAVGAADRGAHAEAALGEVEAVPDAAADAVVGHPAHVALVDAALQDQVFEQAADRVVDERAHERRAQPEAAAQAARDVVLAAALPDAERARRVDPRVAGVEPQHHLAEADEIEAALRGGLGRQAHRAQKISLLKRSAWRRRRSRSDSARPRPRDTRPAAARVPRRRSRAAAATSRAGGSS